MRRIFARRRRFRFALALGLAVAVVGCKKGDAPIPPADSAAIAAQAPVPAPAELAAELVVPKPGELWTALRAFAGPSGALIPTNLELLLVTLLELPAVNASTFDTTRPLVGLVLLSEAGEPSLALGIRVFDGGELVARLGGGADASFESQKSGVPGLTLLASKKAGRAKLGVFRNHLILATDVASIEKAAPYLVRTLAARPAPAEPLVIEIPGAALAGPLTTRARRSWEAYQRELRELERKARDDKGRAPDFGDPSAVIAAADGALSALFDLLSSTNRARLTLTPGAETLALRLELEPEPGRFAEQTIRDLPVGEISPLLELPDAVALALLLRSTPEERKASEAQAGLGLERLLGERLGERDRERLRKAVAAFHAGRGDVGIYGLFADRSLFFSGDAVSPDTMRGAVQDVSRVLELPALKAPLRELIGDFSIARSQIEVGGVKTDRLLVRSRAKAPAPQGGSSHEALFTLRDSSAFLVLGREPGPALTALLLASAGAGTRLENNTTLKTLSGTLPREVSLALYADAGRLGLAQVNAGGGPALVTLGREGTKARLDAVLTAPAAAAIFSLLGTGR